MKVAELIAALSELDPEAEVAVETEFPDRRSSTTNPWFFSHSGGYVHEVGIVEHGEDSLSGRPTKTVILKAWEIHVA